jgi:hypothetical protein
MKYIQLSVFILFLSACSNPSAEPAADEPTVEDTEVVETEQPSGITWTYETKVLEIENEVCSDNCSKVRVEYPIFSGTGSERANLNVAKFFASQLGVVSENPEELLDLERVAKDYYTNQETLKKQYPATEGVQTNLVLTSIETGLGIVSLYYLVETTLSNGVVSPIYYILDLDGTTGEEVILINHIVDMPSFIMLSENEFRNYFKMENEQPYHSLGFEFNLGLFTLPVNYGFTSKGLEYFYNPDEVSLTAKEPKSYTVSFKTLENLLDLKTDYMEVYFQKMEELERQQQEQSQTN